MNIFDRKVEMASAMVDVIETIGNTMDELLCPAVVTPGSYFNCEYYSRFGGGSEECSVISITDGENGEEIDTTECMVIPGNEINKHSSEIRGFC